jgi:hypothetical protein
MREFFSMVAKSFGAMIAVTRCPFNRIDITAENFSAEKFSEKVFGQIFRKKFSDKVFGQSFRTKFSDKVFGQSFRTKFSDKFFGQRFRTIVCPS